MVMLLLLASSVMQVRLCQSTIDCRMQTGDPTLVAVIVGFPTEHGQQVIKMEHLMSRVLALSKGGVSVIDI
jgi:hypothetical protein